MMMAARLALAVFDFDNPNLGVHRPERNAVGVLAGVMIVRNPGFPGMPVITNDQAIEAQLRKAPVASGNPRGEEVLGGGVHCLEDLLTS